MSEPFSAEQVKDREERKSIMQKLKWLTLTLALGLLLTLGWTANALAQNPTGSDPSSASYLDNQAHTIPGGARQWYRFIYGGGNSLITVTLLNGAGSNLRFNVYTPDQIIAWAPNVTPIGRGTVLSINCNSGLPTPGGGCQGNDLTWGGKFRAGGTIYVELLNDNPQTVTFVLTVAGDDVAQCLMPGQTPTANSAAPPCSPPSGAVTGTSTAIAVAGPSQTGTPVATAGVTPTATTTTAAATQLPPASPAGINAPNTFYTDPYHALPLNGQVQTVPGNASLWFRFDYAGDGSNIIVRMENGALNGLEFSVYLPEQAPSWYNETPIGRGTATACATASSDPTLCGENATALLWSGKFRVPGTYFVRVVNPTSNAVQFLLTVTGTGVSVSP